MEDKKITIYQYIEHILNKDMELLNKGGMLPEEDLAKINDGLEVFSHMKNRKSDQAFAGRANQTTELSGPLKTGIKVVDKLEKERVFDEKRETRHEVYKARKARSDRLIYAI